MTPFNNPTLALLMMVALKPHRINWELNPDNLTIFSVGTGTRRTRVSISNLAWGGPLRVTLGAMLSLMSDNEYLALTQLQWLGQCMTPWVINSEIEDLCNNSPPGGDWFRFARYDVRLETEWLSSNLALDLTEKEVTRMRRMDDPGIIKCIYGVARLAAEKQVLREHLFPKKAATVEQKSG